MASSNDIIAHSLTVSQNLLQRFVADLTPAEQLHRITPTANCAAWLIGHLVMSDRGALKRLGVNDLPPLPDGFEKRFSRDAGCPEASEFGDVSQLMPMFNKHREMLVATVKSASPQQLDAPLEKPHPLFKTPGEFANFMAQHTTMHAGQITMIRRSLGRPPMI